MIGWRPYFETFRDLIGPTLFAVSLLMLLLGILSRALLKSVDREMVVFMVAVGLLGGVTGMIAGANSEPIVGAVLTALLGIISALLSYMFTQQIVAHWRGFLPFVMIGLLLSATAGLSVGRAYKGRWDDYDAEVKKQQLRWEKVELEELRTRKLIQICDEAFETATDVYKCRAAVIAQ